VYIRLRWLNAYAQINHVAMQKAIDEFIKTHFDYSNNILDKKLNFLVNEKCFTSKSNVRSLIDEIVENFA
jgi:hypothetical protein